MFIYLGPTEAFDDVSGTKVYEGEQNRSDDKFHDTAAVSHDEKGDERRDDRSSEVPHTFSEP